jgi:hypothetical protein
VRSGSPLVAGGKYKNIRDIKAVLQSGLCIDTKYRYDQLGRSKKYIDTTILRSVSISVSIHSMQVSKKN